MPTQSGKANITIRFSDYLPKIYIDSDSWGVARALPDIGLCGGQCLFCKSWFARK